MKISGLAWTACMAVALAACSEKLDGTYTDGIGLATYTFQPNGKVLVSSFLAEVQVDYEVDGNKILLTGQDGQLVLRRQDDGSLQGPMGLKLVKEPAARR
jgi:hypothetical protein